MGPAGRKGAGRAGGGLPLDVMVAAALDESVAPALSVIVKVRLNVPALTNVCEAVGDDELVTLLPSPHCHVYLMIDPVGACDPPPFTTSEIPCWPAYGPPALARGPTDNEADLASPHRLYALTTSV